jgi:type I restriction enzyme M protein
MVQILNEDRDEYLAENVYWVPKDARWSKLQAGSKLPEIGSLIQPLIKKE